MADRNWMRWYDPRVGVFQWRVPPEDDEESLGLLDGYPGADEDREVYRHWRGLGASITASLIRAGEAAAGRNEERADG